MEIQVRIPKTLQHIRLRYEAESHPQSKDPIHTPAARDPRRRKKRQSYASLRKAEHLAHSGLQPSEQAAKVLRDRTHKDRSRSASCSRPDENLWPNLPLSSANQKAPKPRLWQQRKAAH